MELEKLSDKKYIALLGEFGSGKSELAVNCALRERRSLADLDIAKPMNGSRDFRDALEAAGLTVIAIPRQFEHLEVRMLPQRLPQLFASGGKAVFDVGGGDSAVVIGQFADYFNSADSEVLLVVNTFRPFSRALDEIVEEKCALEARTGLHIGALVCNCNLADATDRDTALSGLGVICAAAAQLDLPLKCVVLPEWLRGEIDDVDYPCYFIKRNFRYVK